jgi:hypothetical protein
MYLSSKHAEMHSNALLLPFLLNRDVNSPPFGGIPLFFAGKLGPEIRANLQYKS